MGATPAFGTTSRLTDVFHGMALPFRAFRLLFGSRRLFLLAALAALVTLISLVALVAGLGMYTDEFVRRFVFAPESWYGQVFFWILVAVSFLLFLVVGANTLPLLVLVPLQDPLSEATEACCGDYQASTFSLPGFARGAWVALGHALARVAVLVLGHALLFALNLIPGAGSVLWTVTSILWTMGWLAAEYLDAPMARHLYSFAQVRQAVFSRLPLCLGFGAAVYVLLWIPVLNLFFIPTAIVAGTLLFRGLRACGALPPPPAR